MVRNAIRFYAWAAASWLVEKLDPTTHALQEEEQTPVETDDSLPAYPPSSLDVEGWELLQPREATVTLPETPTAIAGSFASRMQRDEP